MSTNIATNEFIKYLSLERVRCQIETSNQKCTLQLMSQLFSDSLFDTNSQDILSALIARERLGSTAISENIALPHARLAGINNPIIALATLKTPIAYECGSKKTVNIICALLIAEQVTDQHLQILANLAALFEQQDFCHALQRASSDKALFNAATQWDKT